MTPYEVEIFINTSHFLGRNLLNQVFFDSYLNVNIGMLKSPETSLTSSFDRLKETIVATFCDWQKTKDLSESSYSIILCSSFSKKPLKMEKFSRDQTGQ